MFKKPRTLLNVSNCHKPCWLKNLNFIKLTMLINYYYYYYYYYFKKEEFGGNQVEWVVFSFWHQFVWNTFVRLNSEHFTYMYKIFGNRYLYTIE